MSRWERRRRRPSQYQSDRSSTICRLLAEIEDDTNSIGRSTTKEDYFQRLSDECKRIWEAIQCFPPVELQNVYDQIEYYRDLMHDILGAVNSNTMTEVEANIFIGDLTDFVHGFETQRTTRCRPDSAFSASFFRNPGSVNMPYSSFVMNNQIDPGTLNHLKHIKYALFIQTTVLF